MHPLVELKFQNIVLDTGYFNSALDPPFEENSKKKKKRKFDIIVTFFHIKQLK